MVNAEDSRSEPPWMWVRIPASPKKLDGNYGPLIGRKTNENNKKTVPFLIIEVLLMGQVTPKKYLKKTKCTFFRSVEVILW